MFSFSKKLLAGVVLVLFVGMFGTVLTVKAKGAITDSGVEPITVNSVYISNARAGLSISSKGVASVSAGVVGRPTVNRIEAKVRLQKYNSSSRQWVTVKYWDGSSQGDYYSMTKSYTVSNKGSYRVMMTASVFSNGKVETTTATSGTSIY